MEILNGKIIRSRNTPCENLAAWLNPDFHDMNFGPITALIYDAQIYLKGESIRANYLENRLKFLDGLEAIIDAFKQAENPYDKAKEDFKFLLKQQFPHKSAKTVEYLFETCFNGKESFNMNLWKSMKRKNKESETQCFSGMMTNRDCIQFYLDNDCFTDTFKEDFGEEEVSVRLVAIHFLGKDQIGYFLIINITQFCNPLNRIREKSVIRRTPF